MHTAHHVEKFEQKRDRSQGAEACWPWTGARHERGYGQYRMDGRLRRASQVAWEIANGAPFPVGQHALHSCDNPPCCNPAHIRPGTPSENVSEAYAKGRVPHRAGVCARGHELTADTRYKAPSGRTECRVCKRDRRAGRLETATLANPRAATLADLRPGDVCFVIADMFAPHPPIVKLGTVTERTAAGGLRVQTEVTNPVHTPGGPAAYFADGRSVMTRGVRIALEMPEGARRVGSLAVAS